MAPKKKPTLSSGWQPNFNTPEQLLKDALQNTEDFRSILVEATTAYQRWLESPASVKKEAGLMMRNIVVREEPEDLFRDERSPEVLVQVLKAAIEKLFSLDAAHFAQLSAEDQKEVVATTKAVDEADKSSSYHKPFPINGAYNKFQRRLALNSINAFFTHRHRHIRARSSSQVSDALDIVWAWIATQIEAQLNSIFPKRMETILKLKAGHNLDPRVQSKDKGVRVRKTEGEQEQEDDEEEDEEDFFDDDDDDDEGTAPKYRFLEDWKCREKKAFDTSATIEQLLAGYDDSPRERRPNVLKLKYKPVTTKIANVPKGILTKASDEELLVLWKFIVSSDVESGGLFDVHGEVVIRSGAAKSEKIVGAITGKLIKRDDLRHNMQMISNLEEHSDEMGAFAAELFTNHGDLQYSLRSEAWARTLDRGNVMLMDGFVLDTSVREKGLGAVLLREALPALAARPDPKMAQRVSCIFVKPQPWVSGSRNYTGSPNDLEFIENETLAAAMAPAVTKKVELLFASNGFARICDGSEWFACVPRGINIPIDDLDRPSTAAVDDKSERTHPVWNSTAEKNFGRPFKVIAERFDEDDNGMCNKWVILKCSEASQRHTDPLYNTIGLDSLSLRYISAQAPKVCTCGRCARPLVSNRTSTVLYTALDMLRDMGSIETVPNAKTSPSVRRATASLTAVLTNLFMRPDLCEAGIGSRTPTAKSLRKFAERSPAFKPFFDAGCRVEHLFAYAIDYAMENTTQNLIEANDLVGDISDPAPAAAAGTINNKKKTTKKKSSTTNDNDDIRTAAAEGEAAAGGNVRNEAPELIDAACDRDFLWHELPWIFYDDGFVPNFQVPWKNDCSDDDDDEFDDDDSEDPAFGW